MMDKLLAIMMAVLIISTHPQHHAFAESEAADVNPAMLPLPTPIIAVDQAGSSPAAVFNANRKLTNEENSQGADQPILAMLHQHYQHSGKQGHRKMAKGSKHKGKKELFKQASTTQSQHKKHVINNFPTPDIRTLKEFVDQAKDYGDGTSDMAWFEGPTKTCKRKKAAEQGQPDDVEIMVAYPHPLSDEDREKMESMSRAYWSAVGTDPIKDDKFLEQISKKEVASRDDGKGKVYFERILEETEEEEIEV